MKRLEAVVSGRVQGVGFREFVRHEASTRGIAGYVRNSDDGRDVELVAEGEDGALDELLRALHEGPRFARAAARTPCGTKGSADRRGGLRRSRLGSASSRVRGAR